MLIRRVKSQRGIIRAIFRYTVITLLSHFLKMHRQLLTNKISILVPVAQVIAKAIVLDFAGGFFVYGLHVLGR